MQKRTLTWITISLLSAAFVLAACGAADPTAEALPAPIEEQAPVQEEPAQEEPAPVEEAPTDSAPAEEAAPVSVSEGTFVVVSGESEARFRIGEILTGAYNEVVGVTDDLTGQIAADYTNPAASSVILLQVDLSTLQTDSSMRDRAMKERFLETADPANQYAEFVSTNLIGVPAAVTIGQPFDFQIVGNLTIHGTTREVTFNATVTPVSETRLAGSASVTVLWADYGIEILRLPQQVASVEDDVILEIDLVAEQQ